MRPWRAGGKVVLASKEKHTRKEANRAHVGKGAPRSVTRPLTLLLSTLMLVLVLAAATAFALRENLVRFLLNPRSPYQTYVLPPAPNYATTDAWAAQPGMPSRANEIPVGLPPVSRVPDVDVFYVHPTTYYKSAQWNGPIDDPESRRLVDDRALPNQASPFNAAGRIFAPRYRQATLYALLTHNQDGRWARKSAYQDVARAFEYYLRNINQGRPLLLVGHGQGGLHAIRLLQEYVVGKPLQHRLVAAYIIDFALPLDMFRVSLSTLKPCETATETHCVVSWNALEYGKDPSEITTRSQVWDIFGNLVTTEGRPLTCINPLTWALNELPAPNPLNKGGVAFEDNGGNSGPVPEITGAQCRDGILYVDRPKDGRFRRYDWPGSRYRLASYNLFYMNLRENAVHRVQAFLANPSLAVHQQ